MMRFGKAEQSTNAPGSIMSIATTSRRRREATPEQKQAAAEKREKLRNLTKQIAAMSAEQREALVQKVGAVLTCEGHPLSPFNTCFLISQAGERGVSVVGGFRQWQTNGRYVQKGATGLAIWVPIGAPKGEPTGEEEAKPRYKLVWVFDIQDTAENGAAEGEADEAE